MNRLVNYVIIFIAILLPTTSFAAPSTFADFIYEIVRLANMTVPILMGLAVLIYFWNIMGTMWGIDGSAENAKKLREAAIWGIIILFVMMSIWGIIRMLHQFIIPI